MSDAPPDARIDLNKGRRWALVIVDVQNDFIPGGALAVPDGDKVVAICNELRRRGKWCAVFLTQDWHPVDHASFASNNDGAALFSTKVLDLGEQVMWPNHCVQNTRGAEFHSDLERHEDDIVIQKGTVKTVDSYSGFGDAFQGKFERTELADRLRALAVDSVVVVGLATDYCVAATAKDASREGFGVTVVLDGCRGIAPETVDKELQEMKAQGVQFVQTVEEALTVP